jgi:hypothetical protein
MTVLVLDSPELIARAAALEAAQTRTQVPAESARVVNGEATARYAGARRLKQIQGPDSFGLRASTDPFPVSLSARKPQG